MSKLDPNMYVSALFIFTVKVSSAFFFWFYCHTDVCVHCPPVLQQYTHSLDNEVGKGAVQSADVP